MYVATSLVHSDISIFLRQFLLVQRVHTTALLSREMTLASGDPPLQWLQRKAPLCFWHGELNPTPPFLSCPNLSWRERCLLRVLLCTAQTSTCTNYKRHSTYQLFDEQARLLTLTWVYNLLLAPFILVSLLQDAICVLDGSFLGNDKLIICLCFKKLPSK